MLLSLLIAISFSIGFFIESIIGFGGSLIAYSIAGFFIDIKQLVLIGLYIGTCSSAYIFLSDSKSFSKEIFFQTLPITLFGTFIGVLIFKIASSEIMLICFGILSIVLSLKTIFIDNIKIPKVLKNTILLIGGVSHGIFGIGGPFVVNAIREDFSHKSQLRTTLALFFIVLNFLRFFQLLISNQLNLSAFDNAWLAVIPVFVAIYFGFKIHLKISDNVFKKMIAAITFFSGIVFLLK